MKILSTRNVLTLIGSVALLEGIGFFFAAEVITKSAFITFTGSDAIRVGTLMHEALAGVMLCIGTILLFSRNAEISSAKKILNGVGVGYIIFFGIAMKHFIGGEAQPPIPALVLLVILAALALITANRKSA